MIAGILPILFVAYAKTSHGFKIENNAAPRTFLATASGKSQRAKWAQENSWEAFAPFAAAVIIASQVGVAQSLIDSAAMLFVAARILYGYCYIKDLPTLRSVVWTVGIAANLSLYFFAYCA